MINKAVVLFLFVFSSALAPLSVSAQEQVELDQYVISVNINEASAEELSSMLVGVGEVRAAAIVAYRSENGDFESFDELQAVSGIGEATIERNRSIIAFE